MKILLVEDHPIFRFGVRHVILQRWPDAQVREVETLEAALAEISQTEWDIAVVDLNLPDTAGIECVASLRRQAAKIKLLVLSLHTEVAYAKQVMQMGAMGYLPKDHATNELVAAIEKVSQGGRYIGTSLAAHIANNFFDNQQALPHEMLSAQEYRVMLQIAGGKKLGDIALAMHLSPKTVSTYRTRILEKMQLTGNVELARYCITNKLSENEL